MQSMQIGAKFYIILYHLHELYFTLTKSYPCGEVKICLCIWKMSISHPTMLYSFNFVFYETFPYTPYVKKLMNGLFFNLKMTSKRIKQFSKICGTGQKTATTQIMFTFVESCSGVHAFFACIFLHSKINIHFIFRYSLSLFGLLLSSNWIKNQFISINNKRSIQK